MCVISYFWYILLEIFPLIRLKRYIMSIMRVLQSILIRKQHVILFILIMILLCTYPGGLSDSIVTCHFQSAPFRLNAINFAIQLFLVCFDRVLLIVKSTQPAFLLLYRLIQIYRDLSIFYLNIIDSLNAFSPLIHCLRVVLLCYDHN